MSKKSFLFVALIVLTLIPIFASAAPYYWRHPYFWDGRDFVDFIWDKASLALIKAYYNALLISGLQDDTHILLIKVLHNKSLISFLKDRVHTALLTAMYHAGINDNSITTAKIADNAVTDEKVVDDLTAINYLPLTGGTLIGDLSLGLNQLKNAILEKLSSFPSSPAEGQFFWYTSDKKPYWYDATSSQWRSADFPEEVNYIIYKEGNTIYAKNGSTGRIDFSGTDARTVIQSAINPLTTGGKIILRNGTFELTNYLSLTHGLVLEGMGESTVLKQANGANLNYLIFIYLNSASSFGRALVKNFVLDGNKANQTGGSGYGIYADTYSSIYSDFVSFENLYVKDTYGIGIETNGNYYEFRNVYVYGANSHGFVIRDYHARLMNTISRSNVGDGYLLRGTGLHTLIGVKALQNDGNGIHLYGADTTDLRCEIIGGSVMSNDQHGILFEGASNNRVTGVWIQWNSYSSANSYDNIHFKSYSSSHSKNNILEGNTIRAGSYARYQIYEADSNQDYNLVMGNQILDAGQTGKIVLQGSNSKVKNNVGYITEISGTAQITDPNTSVTVSHSLDYTPTLNDISVTPTNNLGNATRFWISNPTAANFTINIDVAPGGGNTADFVWNIERN